MFFFSSGGCVAEVVDIRANYQGYKYDVLFLQSYIYFLNCERACHIITRIIFNVCICLNDINITKVNRHDEKARYLKQFHT